MREAAGAGGGTGLFPVRGWAGAVLETGSAGRGATGPQGLNYKIILPCM